VKYGKNRGVMTRYSRTAEGSRDSAQSQAAGGRNRQPKISRKQRKREEGVLGTEDWSLQGRAPRPTSARGPLSTPNSGCGCDKKWGPGKKVCSRRLRFARFFSGSFPSCLLGGTRLVLGSSKEEKKGRGGERSGRAFACLYRS